VLGSSNQRPACHTERYPGSDRKAISCLCHRRASALPPSAKVTSTKLFTEPAQASVSSGPIKSSECMINPASQSPTFLQLWDGAQEQRPTSQTQTHTHHTRLTFPRSQLHSASLLSLSEPPCHMVQLPGSQGNGQPGSEPGLVGAWKDERGCTARVSLGWVPENRAGHQGWPQRKPYHPT